MVHLNKQSRQTFVWVTHSEEVGAMAHRLIRMRDGQITSDSEDERATRSLAGLPA
jgi:ABC-type lipoprotein export system ATPase subunit